MNTKFAVLALIALHAAQALTMVGAPQKTVQPSEDFNEIEDHHTTILESVCDCDCLVPLMAEID